MKKVLFVATVVKLHIMVFHLPYLEWFKKNGYEVHVAASNDYENKNECKIPFCDKFFDLPFERSPLKNNNLYVLRELKRIIDMNDYKIVHCHTPMGGAIGRLSARKARNQGTKVIYTAHGFHFYKGAPIKNWVLYYPIEKWLSKYTDILITINKEDFERAKKSLKAKRVEYIPGVGVNVERFKNTKVDMKAKRKEIDVPEDVFVLLSVGELNKNKNHETVIKALAKLNNSKIYYVICGQGPLKDYLRSLAKELGLEKQVKLLGYRRDIAEICKTVDLFAFPSLREGLGLAALEAMASGLPLITSNIHGILDYSTDAVTGFNCSPTNVEGFSKAINQLMSNLELRKRMGQYNLEAVKCFDINNISKDVARIYQSLEVEGE